MIKLAVGAPVRAIACSSKLLWSCSEANSAKPKTSFRSFVDSSPSKPDTQTSDKLATASTTKAGVVGRMDDGLPAERRSGEPLIPWSQMTRAQRVRARSEEKNRLLRQKYDYIEREVIRKGKSETVLTRALVRRHAQCFDTIPIEQRNQQNFENAIGLFLLHNPTRRGHVEFITAARRRLREFGAHKDPEVYKKLLNVFPKGKFVPTSVFHVGLHYFKRENECCVEVLDEMEWNHIPYDQEMSQIVKNTFGANSYAAGKVYGGMYWHPKFRYRCPYLDRRDVPMHPKDIELARLAIQMMCRDPANNVYEKQTNTLPHCPEDTFIIYGQSRRQMQHLISHPKAEPLYVDGPFLVYIREHPVYYFQLSAAVDSRKRFETLKSEKCETEEDWINWKTKYNSMGRTTALQTEPTMHEQPDGVVLSLAVAGKQTKEAAIAWLDLLQQHNPVLANLSVVFRMRQSTVDTMTLDELWNEQKRRSDEFEPPIVSG